jgi:endoglucanase
MVTYLVQLIFANSELCKKSQSIISLTYLIIIMSKFILLKLIVFWIIPIGLFAQPTESIKVNQVGYFTKGIKKAAVVETSATEFNIRDLSGSVVYTGSLSSARYWNQSAENVKEIDFTDFEQEGIFVIAISNVGTSFPFTISLNALNEVSKESVRYFYYNRCSYELTEEHAGIFARPGGHWDTDVTVCDNPFPSGNPVGTIISSPGGWYDAGDYNKYLLTAGISVYTLMSAYEQYPQYVERMNLNIPESRNQIPDLLDECLFELRWLFTMQDSDGGVYTKLTNAGFGGMQMPHIHDQNNGIRYVCQKNTPATLQFVAAMASAYRIYEPIDHLLPGFRDSCLNAAISAWDWCIANPSVNASQCNCNITTGSYGDSNPSDEFIWAACEMYLATGDISYYNSRNISGANVRTPDWGGNKESLGYISLLLNKDKLTGQALTDLPLLESKFRTLVDEYVASYEANPYRIIKSGGWIWGSNGDAGNQAFLTLTAYTLFGENKFLEAALSNVDYLLGKNTTSYCFLTGFGSKRVYNAHHRISAGDDIYEPVPGMMFGGPYQSATNFMIEKWPNGQSEYAMTEVTINWNAPFAFTTVALQAILGGDCEKPNMGNNFSICDASIEFPITLHSGIEEGAFTWYKNGIVIENAESSSLSIASSEDVAGIYKVEYNNNDCSNYGEIKISDEIPQPNLGPNQTLRSEYITLDANVEGAGYLYTWYINNNLIDGATARTYNANEQNKTYKVEISSENCSTVFDEILITNIQLPYNDMPSTIPGVIEAEEYDIPLATGLAYSDTDVGNTGGQFRNDDVDIEICSSGGYNVGYIEAGEWLEYTVNVQTTGNYSINFDVAGRSSVGQFYISIGEQSVSPILNVSTAGSTNWQDWKTISVNDISLTAGRHIIRVVFEVGGFNFDKMTFTLEEALLQTHNIFLKQGWNLVSFYIQPNNNILEELSSNQNIVLIKTEDKYYINGQPAFLNSLLEIETGKGYMIYCSDDTEFSIEGNEYFIPIIQNTHSFSDGWHLLGMGTQIYNTEQLSDNIIIVKDLNGFYWEKGENQHQNLEVGKAYFVKVSN